MSIKQLSLSLLLATLTLVSCKKEEDPAPPSTTLQILPGIGTTELKIGDMAQKAIDLYGAPQPSYGAANGIYTHFLIYSSKGVIVYCEPTPIETFNAQMIIKSLVLTANYTGKTEKGIGIGSTKVAVKAAYGEPASSSEFFGDAYNIGITFVYDDNEKVEKIEVE